jgi:hypothetical protein
MVNYRYNLDIVWIIGTFGDKPVRPGRRVHNIRYDKVHGYIFNFEKDPVDYHCHYNWAFVVDEPENLKKLKFAKKLRDRAARLRKRATKAYNNVKYIDENRT